MLKQVVLPAWYESFRVKKLEKRKYLGVGTVDRLVCYIFPPI